MVPTAAKTRAVTMAAVEWAGEDRKSWLTMRAPWRLRPICRPGPGSTLGRAAKQECRTGLPRDGSGRTPAARAPLRARLRLMTPDVIVQMCSHAAANTRAVGLGEFLSGEPFAVDVGAG